tara:strand:- start:1385 stop:1576 length:192 start_codon:yes stop_codon:yes gene_type:complete
MEKIAEAAADVYEQTVGGRLATHEAVCAERWKETIERIKRLEKILIVCAGGVIAMMAAMLWKF